jgi:hypothetical protein
LYLYLGFVYLQVEWVVLWASVVVVSVSRSLIFTGGEGCSIGFSSCRMCI